MSKLPSRASRVMCRSLELVQALPPNLLLSCMMALALNNYRMSGMENVSFSGMGLLERPLWSVLPPETMVISLVYLTAGGKMDICGLGCCPMLYWYLWSMLPPKAMSIVCGPCYHQRPCGCPWSVLPLEIMLVSMVCAATKDHVDIHVPCCCWRP